MPNGHAVMDKVFVGSPVKDGTLQERYANVLMEGETVEVEFKGVRDGMIFTDRRVIVLNAQGITGKKLEIASFPWRSITAYSVENSGTFDLEAELKLCGSGWGVCEVIMTKGTDTAMVCRYINKKVLA
jgi:hypothetical protein